MTIRLCRRRLQDRLSVCRSLEYRFKRLSWLHPSDSCENSNKNFTFFDTADCPFKTKPPFLERKSSKENILGVAQNRYISVNVSGVSGDVLFALFLA